MRYSFSDIPEELLTILRDVSRGKTVADHTGARTEGYGGKLLLLILGLVVLGVTIAATYEMRSDGVLERKLLARFPFAIAGVLFTLAAAGKLVALLTSALKPCIVITPDLFVITGRDGDPVTMLRIRDLEAAQLVSMDASGWVRSGGKVHGFSLPDFQDQKRLHEALQANTQRLRATPSEQIRAHDWIRRLDERNVAAGGSTFGRALVRFFVCLVLAAVAGPVVVTGTAVLRAKHGHDRDWSYTTSGPQRSVIYERFIDHSKGLQEWLKDPRLIQLGGLGVHDAEAQQRYDDLLFEEAKKDGGATKLRDYRKKLPAGKHLKEVAAALQDLYEKAEERYRETASKAGAETQAIEGMKALLAFLLESDEPTVWVSFMPVEGLAGAEKFEKAAAERTGSKNIVPVGPCFTAEANKGREASITQQMRSAFGAAIGSDLFDLKLADKKEPGPRFLVRYEVLGTTRLYSEKDQDAVPAEERRIYIGIELAFDFTLQVPGQGAALEDDPTKGYRFSMHARPAPNFSVSTRKNEKLSAWAVYSTMAATAFTDFGAAMRKAYGVER